jgi:hypothetical protein
MVKRSESLCGLVSPSSMKLNFRNTLTLSILVLCILLGWWIFLQLKSLGTGAKIHKPVTEIVEIAPARKAIKGIHVMRQVYRDEFRDGTTVEMFASMNPSEVILRFPSDESYQSFLTALSGSHTKLVGQLDRLRAMRLVYENWDEFSRLLDGEHIKVYNSLSSLPATNPARIPLQGDAVGFGDSLLPWLGITTDNSTWGKGVRVAVIDTGVVPHSDLPGLSTSIAIVPFPENLTQTCGHGTAVASLIAGCDSFAHGIAPAVDLVSIRVADDTGKSDSFALAAGILAALDAKV